MTTKSGSSDDEKTMHPQCITVADALEAVDGKRTWITGTQHVLAAEVRRLRGANEGLIAEIALMGAALKKQDAELKSVRDEHHDLLVRLRLAGPKSDEPPPSAAPKGEPYNGY